MTEVGNASAQPARTHAKGAADVRQARESANSWAGQSLVEQQLHGCRKASFPIAVAAV